MSIDLSDEFPQQDNTIYLNHAAVAPWCRRSLEAIQQFGEENVRQGAKDYPQWEAKEKTLREQFRTLLNAPSVADIALLKNTSEALSVVAHGLTWQAGDNIVITDQEFPSNRIVWESLAPYGVSVRQASTDSLEATPEEALFSQVDDNTRLIAISAVQYASGIRMDLHKIGQFCHEHEILFCVDAIQQLGALQLDVQAIRADFVMADGHKWLLGAEGLAVFYCPEAHRERLRLYQYGWHMVANYHNFDAKTWTVANSARRFECGSPNMLGVRVLSASLSLLLEVGMTSVEQQLLEKTAMLIRLLAEDPEFVILSPTTAARRSGIVTFRHRQHHTKALFEHLRQHNVVCAMRGGGIRFSPHFYTPTAKLHQALQFIREQL